jgi:uncharacterized low-complexity protein
LLVFPVARVAVLALVAGASLVSAQAPPIRSTPPQTIGGNPTRTPKSTSPRFTKPRNSRGVTASGCLQYERAVASRPDVLAGGGGTGDGYVLTGVKLKGLGVTSGGQDATAELYRVAGLEDAKFREHLNQRVEVKGRLNLGLITAADQAEEKSADEPAGDGKSADGKTADGKTADGKTADGKPAADGKSAGGNGVSTQPKGLPAITASSIKTLASTCEAGSN